jgi:serine/threonine protein kinase
MKRDLVKDYRIIDAIGEGGMATVYLAEHQLLGNRVAIKILHDEFVRNKNIRNRFIAEAKNMARMSHQNIIKVTDLVDDGDMVAFVMEYIEGQTLKQYLDAKGKLSDEEIKKLFVQMLDAVGYVHEQGLVHRDIKPSNFIISGKGVVKLLDFGIAKNTDVNSSEYTITGTTQNMGTPMYMSPEQIKSTKDVTHQSDIYSLGVVLWQMVAGRRPYDANTLSSFELQLKIVSETLPITQTLWDDLILACTEKEVQKRVAAVDNLLAIIKNGVIEKVVESPKTDFEKTIIEEKRIYPIDIEWSDIPAGSFTMGSPSTEKERGEYETQYQVTLTAFKISKYAVTFEQYDAFCEATDRSKPRDEGWGRGKRPVINVSWDDASAFATWMGCRLPTGAEWEYACRAGTKTPFNTGYNITTRQANFDGKQSFSFLRFDHNKYPAKTLPVGSFAPNAWGLYDMHGNVYEWCTDSYGDYLTQTQTNPTFPSLGTLRVIRGGCWFSNANNCRSATHNYINPRLIVNYVGFRIVSSK